MNFFKQVDLNWMGKAKYFVSLSLLLLAIGVVATIYNGGPTYGIDFKGGTLVTVRFAKPLSEDSIRKDLEGRGLGQISVQTLHDITNPSVNDVVIGLEVKDESEQALDAGKVTIVAALQQSFPAPDAGKQDFNTVAASQLSDALVQRDPIGLGISAGDRYKQIAQQLVDFRNKNSNGIVTDLANLSNAGVAPQVVTAVSAAYYAGPFVIEDAQIVGPKVGGELRKQAVYVTLYALGGMLLYIAIRFAGGELLRISGDAGSVLVGALAAILLLGAIGLLVYGFFHLELGASLLWLALISVGSFVTCWFLRQSLFSFIDFAIFGAAAVVAVFHDVLITLGLFSLFHHYFEISLTVIAALLTLVGYSMNDTIVIFDRIRENSRLMRREPFPDIVNRSINQTLSRTILTSGLTFLTVLVLFIMGGPALRSFSFALVIGIVVGTYSSFGIAAPLVVAWNRWRGPKATLVTGSAAGNRPGPARRVPA
jgi:preprotein translocase subunit SecF